MGSNGIICHWKGNICGLQTSGRLEGVQAAVLSSGTGQVRRVRKEET